MDEIINYINLPKKERRRLPAQLSAIDFYPAHGGYMALYRAMETSRPGKLPQFLLVRRNGALIGYLFLIAEQEKNSKVFPWWAVSNADELPLSTALDLLEQGTALCRACGAEQLAQRIQAQADHQRQGIGRRPENLCR